MDEFGLANTGTFQPMGEWGGIVQVERGNNMAIFFNKAVHNPAKSAQLGRPHYEDIVFVRIAPPGERLNIVERPARDEDRRRFPVQWAQFQQNRAQIPEGMPIDLLYPEQPAIAATLRAHGVMTVEQCADLSSNAIENIGMGAQTYVNDAQKMLDESSKGVAAVQHRRDLEERDQQIRILKQTVDQLKATVNHMEGMLKEAPNLQAVQRIIAGAMARPEHMPNVGFDFQATQIAANHPSADEARARKRPGRAEPVVAAPPRRNRVRAK